MQLSLKSVEWFQDGLQPIPKRLFCFQKKNQKKKPKKKKQTDLRYEKYNVCMTWNWNLDPLMEIIHQVVNYLPFVVDSVEDMGIVIFLAANGYRTHSDLFLSLQCICVGYSVCYVCFRRKSRVKISI